MLTLIGLGAAFAAIASAAGRADEQPRPPARFEPGDISIGEPVALPFPASPGPLAERQPAADAVAGSGWLGMSIAESTVPGRWAVVEVAARGPAAAAGILPGDEVRAIDGVAPSSADHIAQLLTAIVPGRDVSVQVARGDRLADVAVRAVPRPLATMSREAPSNRPAAVPPQPAAGAPLDVDGGGERQAVASVLAPATAGSPTPAPPVVPIAPSGAAARQPLVVPAAEPAAVGAAPAVTAGVGDSASGPALPFARPAAELSRPPERQPAAPFQAETPAPPARLPTNAVPRGRTALGVRTVPIDAVTQARFQLPDAAGAYVIGVVHDLPASRAGIPPGSVIVAMDDRPVRSPQDLTRLVTSSPIDRPVSLAYVLPDGSEKQAAVVLQPLEIPLERALVGDFPTPGLEPAPRTTRRIVDHDADERAALRAEIGRLRSRLESLERRIDTAPGGP